MAGIPAVLNLKKRRDGMTRDTPFANSMGGERDLPARKKKRATQEGETKGKRGFAGFAVWKRSGHGKDANP